MNATHGPAGLLRAHGPLPPARYRFRVAGWKGAPWHVRRLNLVEAISEPYRLTLELVNDGPWIDLDELLGDTCELEIDRHASPRRVSGVILGVDDLGRSAGRHHVRLEIGPALALLDQRVDTRAWQERRAPEILRELLSGPLAELGRKVRLDGLDLARYPIREYCVQYRESDLDFASRLMQEEGIAYYFSHASRGAEELILVDDNRRFGAVQAEPIALLDAAPDTAGAESVRRFSWGRRLTSTAVAQRAYDWQRPTEGAAARREGADLRGREREVYAHDDLVDPRDGERQAAIKQERLRARGQGAAGEGNVTAFHAGGVFKLSGHGGRRDGEYLLTKVTHRGECIEEGVLMAMSSETPAAPRYTNTFECAPLAAAFRPPITVKKPRVMGVQTATVTGPPGEEVYCDEFGRIKILPHWDRLSGADEASSWWVRLAQPIAGAGFGVMMLPRIGMEVIVDFINGDPDRPIVVGCLHNGDNPPPYALPGDKTKTAIRSSSSPGGGGFNELYFEDQAGAEEVSLHAQRDLNIVVNAGRTLSVGAGDTTSVGANRTAVIGANDSTAVGANKSVTVAANYSESCGAGHSVSVGAVQSVSVGAAQSVSVGAAQSVSVGADQSFTVTGNQTHTITGDQIHTITGNQANTVTGDQSHTVTGNQTHTITGDQVHTITGCQSNTVTGDQTHTITGAHTLTVVSAANHTFQAGATVGITGAYALTISGTLEIDAGGAATLKASRFEISGGDSTIKVEPGSVTITGGCMVFVESSGGVNITGGADVAISGASVRLNC
jgi:type VI secretion system secreted protein VgrG